MCKLGVISQERLKAEVKLLLSANRKSYYTASIGTTTDDIEWPFHASRAISVVAELVTLFGRVHSTDVPVWDTVDSK